MKVAIIGYGRMGKLIEQTIKGIDGMQITGIIALDENCMRDFTKLTDIPDVIIDFSNPAALNNIYKYAITNNVKIVIGTTGYSEEDYKLISDLGNHVPIVQATNFSLGIAVLNKVIRMATPMLKELFDIEIIEKHHNKKIDAPSGTAKTLLKNINTNDEFKVIYGREGNGKREKEIAIHSLRGGTITGEHSVIYAGSDEVLEFKHEAHSKMIFVNGVLAAVRFLEKTNRAGLYTIDDVLGGL